MGCLSLQQIKTTDAQRNTRERVNAMRWQDLRRTILGDPEAIQEYRDRVADLNKHCENDPAVSALLERAYKAQQHVPRWRR